MTDSIGTGTNTITQFSGYHVTSSGSSGTITYNGTDWAGVRIDDLTSMANGTIESVAGIWITDQTIGTNNYGIVLDGDGAGADIVFGADQDKSINFDGNDMQYGGMRLNDMGTKSACAISASIVNPYMCIGFLDHSVTTGNGHDRRVSVHLFRRSAI